MSRTPLTTTELEQLLRELPRWTHHEQTLRRELRFRDFAAAFTFMTHVAAEAEALDHHPDWSNSWNQVSIALTTHSTRCLTTLDAELARRIEHLALTTHELPTSA